MDTVSVNSATIARMVEFLTRELDAAQKRLEELKQEKDNGQAHIEELSLVNSQLREKVAEFESGRVKVKQVSTQEVLAPRNSHVKLKTKALGMRRMQGSQN